MVYAIHSQNPISKVVRSTNLCLENKSVSAQKFFWRDHISDKFGFGGETEPNVRRPFAAMPKATFS